MNPFDLVNTLYSKEYSYEPKLDDDDYKPVVVNKALSFAIGTIHYANFLNGAYNLPLKAQYDFYFYALPKWTKKGKWKKAEPKDNEVEITTFLSEYFDINNQTAEKYVSMLSDEQLEIIRIKMNKGGKSCVR